MEGTSGALPAVSNNDRSTTSNEQFAASLPQAPDGSVCL